jgi:indolepyruvate ferredoxin oxidoreductase beta subunit
MSRRNVEIIISGVGGQGVLLAAEILGNAAMREGLEVIVSEVHGMAQRGGSVTSHVRIGHRIYSPTIIEGSANMILGFEPIETLRSLKFANKDTRIIMNTKQTTPITVSIGVSKYPSLEEVVVQCKKFTKHVTVLDAFKIAEVAGSSMTVNMVLLGALVKTSLLPIKEKTLVQTIRDHVPQKLVDLNLKAFDAGKSVLPK